MALRSRTSIDRATPILAPAAVRRARAALTSARASGPSLLGLANALTAINEKRAACATLDKLKAEFSSPRADLKDQIAASRQRAGCR